MQAETSVNPWWAALTVWGVVNAVNLLQAAGFLSRVRTGDRAINHVLGYVMIALAVPAALALIALVRARAGWRQWVGPAAVAGDGGDDGPAAGVDGRCHARGSGVSASFAAW